MVQTVRIEAEARERAGKGAARATRREGLVPGVVYGAKQEATLVAMDPPATFGPDLPGIRDWTEAHFDFSGYREAIARERSGRAVFGSAGMLAVRQAWRRHRDVARGMFRVAAGVSVAAGITHLLVVVDHISARMYRRFGFKALAERFWVEAIGSFVVPLAAGVERFHAWAFADARETGLPSEDRL